MPPGEARASREADRAATGGWHGENRSSVIDERTSRHAGSSISQRLRMRIEQVFGSGKTIGGLRRTRLRDLARTRFGAYLVPPAHHESAVTVSRRVEQPPV
jgi:hypothetical protein